MGGNTNIATELALLGLLALVWGVFYPLIKIGVETIPPMTLIAAASSVAALLLFAIIRWRGLPLPRDPRLWWRFLLQSLLNSVVPFTLVAWAEQTTDAALATILNSTSPIFAFLLTALITRHEAVTFWKLLGVLSGLLGICLIVGIEALNGLGREIVAQLAIVASTVCYAGAAILGKRFKGLDPMIPAAGSLACGSLVLIPMSLAFNRPWTLVPSLDSLLALLALAVFSMALALVIYFRLVQTLGSVGTTSQSYLRVPVGVGIGYVFLGETMTSTAWIGLACVVAGVIAMTVPARKGGTGEQPARALPE